MLSRICQIVQIISLLLLTSMVSVEAEIYKTKDKQGRTVYTDKPDANTKADLVELKTINTLPTPPTTGQGNQTVVAPPQVNYEVSVVSPANGTSLLADERSITIEVGINQELHPDHQIVYFLDGTQIHESKSTSFNLNEPPRGEHSLHVEIKDASGAVFGKSPPVTITVMRPIVKPKTATVPKKR
jgi:Domain of unknown function (DUF4124)